MLMFVIPVFAKMFSDFGGTLPAPTRIVMGISDFIRAYWWALAGGAFALTWIFKRYRATNNGRRNTDRLAMRIPILGNVVLKSSVARFTRTLGTLIGSGVPILPGPRDHGQDSRQQGDAGGHRGHRQEHQSG
jgi:type IV pilus assembly protein PilC